MNNATTNPFAGVFTARTLHRASVLLDRLQQRHAEGNVDTLEIIAHDDFEAARILALFGFIAFGRTNRSGVYEARLIDHREPSRLAGKRGAA